MANADKLATYYDFKGTKNVTIDAEKMGYKQGLYRGTAAVLIADCRRFPSTGSFFSFL